MTSTAVKDKLPFGVSCANASFTEDRKALFCSVGQGPCAFQRYCGIYQHAITTRNAKTCLHFRGERA